VSVQAARERWWLGEGGWWRGRLGAALLLCLGLAAACAHPPLASAPAPAPAPAAPARARSALAVATGAVLSSALRERTFEVAWGRVRAGFFDPGMGGVNWDSIGAAFRPRAMAEMRSVAFHEVLAEMLATLRVSHTAVLSPERLAAERTREPGWTGVEVRALPEGWVVFRVWRGSPAERAGIRLGDLVDSIFGESTAAIASAGDRPWLRPEESVRARTGTVNAWLAGNRGQVVPIVLQGAAGGIRRVLITAIRYPGPELRVGELPPVRAAFDAFPLAGGVGYIRFTAFVPALEDALRSAIGSFRAAPGLILDLRGNPGGSDLLGDHLAAMLVLQPRELTETRTRAGVRVDRASPTGSGYGGPIAVLLDALSASASEQFTAPLQELGRVLVVGERSAGADLEAAVVDLPTGGVLMYPNGQPRTARGRVIEGSGVAPDVPVRLTRPSLARGHDDQLDAAVDALRRRARAP
jgi:carboxyl-terminal processing protease